tara:strand:- start:2675 stop:3613 length:939 start_codon:yes stop_codon:yes gene_type:complete
MNEFQDDLFKILNALDIELNTLNSKSPYRANFDELAEFIDDSDIVILDGYHFDESYMRVLKRLAARFVVIDDLNKGKYFADIIINHSPHARNAKYRTLKKTKLLLGEQYTLLRPPFYKYAGNGKVRDEVKVITICFGGTDSKNIASQYLEALNHMNRNFKVNIVLGTSNNNPDSEYEKFNQNLINVMIHRDISDEKMASLLLSSDLLIATPSGITMEACTLNIPTITQAVFENQSPFQKFLKQYKLTTCIPEHSENYSDTLATYLNRIVYDKTYRQKMVRNQKNIFDGNSKLRIRKEIEGLAESCGIKKIAT